MAALIVGACFGIVALHWGSASVLQATSAHAPNGGLPPIRSGAEDNGRAQTLARLCDELDGAADSRWSIVDGCPRVPDMPAAMIGIGSRLFLATQDRLESYDVHEDEWDDDFIRLPEHVEPGVTLVGDGEDTVYLASGGDRHTVWRISIRDRQVQQLPDSAELIGRGAALAYWDGELFLAPGRSKDDFLGLEEGTTTWRRLGRIGGESPMHTTFGRSSGFLARLAADLYAWPDHHIRRFDLEKKRWDDDIWLAMRFLPSLDGGGVATGDAGNSIYVACGSYSRSLCELVVAKRPLCYFLKPRLPYPMIGGGDRVAIARKNGIPNLFVYAVEPDNKLCYIPCSQLERVNGEDNVADHGSSWRQLHHHGGGNGVRRWDTRRWSEQPGPMNDSPRTAGTLVAMGALGQELFFVRRAFVRRMQPETGNSTHYPGINLGRYIALGAAGAYDGERYLYMCTGRSTYFLRWDVPRTPPEKKLSGPQPPIDHTDLEVLPPMPAKVGRCAALAHHDGVIYALRGGGTRDLWRYVVAEQRWEVLASLPSAASAPGDRGGGLVANGTGVYAVPDEHVWRYDVETDRWAPFADLDFAPDWDGGMVAKDGERYLYVMRGGISTRLGRVDFGSRRFEELLPRLPDALSGEGNRLAVLTIDGERRLYVHRGHNSNEILWVDTAALEPRDD